VKTRFIETNDRRRELTKKFNLILFLEVGGAGRRPDVENVGRVTKNGFEINASKHKRG
jgi:hypothetical protein